MRFALKTGVALVIAAIAVGVAVVAVYNPFSLKPEGEYLRLNVQLTGAGATFQYPQIAEWASRFQRVAGIEVNYQSVGTGAGQRMFLQDKVVDFAASDPPLSRSQWEQYENQVMQIPWMMGAVVVVYNVPEIPSDARLNLTGEILAKIYKGEIEYWNDPAIVEVNPAAAGRLPAKQIIAVHRSDSSGTTEVFTTFLNKAAPSIWGGEMVGKQVNWPVDSTGRGIGGKGNEGVTQAVIQTQYSIGYVEWSYAISNNLPAAALRNPAGRFVAPSEASIRAAAAGISLPESPLDDFSHVLAQVVYSSNPDSYPISTFGFVFVWTSYQPQEKALALSQFLKWVARDGYNYMVAGYVAPPEPVKNLLLNASSILTQQK
ncbi:MAG: phosphate ABC transporter substrate-binding protein PstS [Thermosphaera sp.]